VLLPTIIIVTTAPTTGINVMEVEAIMATGRILPITTGALEMITAILIGTISGMM
jgi:hypothetical protein